MTPRSTRLLDLFAGCGGLTRGFTDAGFRVGGAVEFDLAAAATYAANFGESVTHWGKIEDFNDVPKVDVVVGGPPCQGFSTLGKRDPLDQRNHLWREFVRVVDQADCDVFVLENVGRFSKSLEYLLLHLETEDDGVLADYSIECMMLNAADFGTPQRRVRTLLVGSRIGPIGTPVPTHAQVPHLDQLPWRTVRQAFEGLAFNGMPTTLPATQTELFGQVIAGEFKLADIHVGRTYQPMSKKRYRLVPPGGNRLDLPIELMYECWKTHLSGSKDVLGRLEWDKPSLTIRTEFFKPEKGRYLHPEWRRRGAQVNRAITHAEAARLQGFDDRHVWCGTKVAIAKQIGNAVPPPMAHAVAKAIRTKLRRGR